MRHAAHGPRFTLALGVLMLSSGRPALALEEQARPRPNMLVLLSDDQRADAVGALGNEDVRTPNMDRLVHSGFTFRRAYCMGSMVKSVCLPSRTMIQTGRQLFRAIELQDALGVPDDVALLPRVFGAAGYTTFRTGKPSNTPTFANEAFQINQYRNRSAECTREHADATIAFIQQEREEPFFAWVAFAAPHYPSRTPPRYRRLYEADDLSPPANFLPLHPFDNGDMLGPAERTLGWPRTGEGVREQLARYYAAISYVDTEIGRILEALEESGQRENTIIVFASDHGLAIGSHGLMGKQSLYEHSMRTPLVICGPGIPADASSTALCYLFDLFPTLCDLAGLTLPAGVDGVSLAPLLRGEEAAPRELLVTAYCEQRAITDGRYKLIRHTRINRSQLFDLESDPYEMHDLSEDEAFAGRLETLAAALAREQVRLGDGCPLSATTPRDAIFHPPESKRKR